MKPKDTIFVHIGMHKTATTSIQHSLSGFTDGRTRYGRIDKFNHSIALLSALSDGAERDFPLRRLRRSVPASDTARQALLEDLNSPERNLVFSAEALPQLDPGSLRDFRQLLASHCSDIRLLAYIREPIGFASSAFQQRAKGLQQWAPNAQTGQLVPLPNYRGRFEKFIDVFGRDAITFVPFDSARFRDGSIICDFCDRVGISPDGLPQARKNTSLSAETVALLVALNRWLANQENTPAIFNRLRRLIDTLADAFPGRFQFSRACIEAELDPEDVAWMEAQAGFTLPAPPPEGDGCVRSMADLETRAEAALPRLQDLLRANGVTAPADTPRRAIRQLLQAMPDIPPQRMGKRGTKKAG